MRNARRVEIVGVKGMTVLLTMALLLLAGVPAGHAEQLSSANQLAAANSPVNATPYIQPIDNGAVDWQKGVLTAKGIGLPPANAVSLAQARAMAVRAAVVDARRNLLSVAKGVQIDSATTIQNAMVRDDVVIERVRGFLQSSQILDTAYMSDGSVEITVGMPLYGGMADAILPPASTFGALRPPTGGLQDTENGLQAPAPEVVPPGAVPDSTPEEDGQSAADLPPVQHVYTGLLVDARGLGVRPAMTPRIVTESGREVYGSAAVSRDFAIRQGMAGYARDIEQAGSNTRVADNPLTIKAVNASGAARTDLVISDADGALLEQAADGREFLKQCRVMIVLD